MTEFNDVVEKCIAKYGDLKVSSFTEYLSPMKYLDYDDYTGTNKATESRITADIKSALREMVTIHEDMF